MTREIDISLDANEDQTMFRLLTECSDEKTEQILMGADETMLKAIGMDKTEDGWQFTDGLSQRLLADHYARCESCQAASPNGGTMKYFTGRTH